MRRTDSLKKTLMVGKIKGRRKGGWQRMRWLDGITNQWTWVWVNWTELIGINNFLYWEIILRASVQFSSVAQLCPTLCDPMTGTPGLPVHHQLLELTQTHVHRVGDAIQPSHPLSSPSPPALNLSQHQGLFQRVSSSHQVAKVLDRQCQHQSFQWIFKTDFLSYGLVGSPCCPRDSEESSLAPQFKSINSSVVACQFCAKC